MVHPLGTINAHFMVIISHFRGNFGDEAFEGFSKSWHAFELFFPINHKIRWISTTDCFSNRSIFPADILRFVMSPSVLYMSQMCAFQGLTWTVRSREAVTRRSR